MIGGEGQLMIGIQAVQNWELADVKEEKLKIEESGSLEAKWVVEE